MLFHSFINNLAEKKPRPRIEIATLLGLVNAHHLGVGTVTFKYFQDFPGAQLGNFIWLDEDRTSAYDDTYSDAIIFINSNLRTDRPMRRLVAAKELMHVFDGEDQRTSTPEDFKKLINEIADKPVSHDISKQYDADRWALWKAIIALVPPWLRAEYLADWKTQDVKAPELAARWWVPESIAASAMSDYYETMCERFQVQRDAS